jgi:hypothetical protein
MMWLPWLLLTEMKYERIPITITAEIQISILLKKRRGVSPYRPRRVNSIISKVNWVVCRKDRFYFKNSEIKNSKKPRNSGAAIFQWYWIKESKWRCAEEAVILICGRLDVKPGQLWRHPTFCAQIDRAFTSEIWHNRPISNDSVVAWWKQAVSNGCSRHLQLCSDDGIFQCTADLSARFCAPFKVDEWGWT